MIDKLKEEQNMQSSAEVILDYNEAIKKDFEKRIGFLLDKYLNSDYYKNGLGFYFKQIYS